MPQELRDALLRLGGPQPAAAEPTDDLRSKLLALGKKSPEPQNEADPDSIAKAHPAVAFAGSTVWGTGPGAAAARKRILDAAGNTRPILRGGTGPRVFDDHGAPSVVGGLLPRAAEVVTGAPPSLEEITAAAERDPKIRELLTHYWVTKRVIDRDFPKAVERRRAASLKPGIDPVAMGKLSEQRLGEGRPGVQGPLQERRPGEPIVDPIEIVEGEPGVADTPEKLATGDALRGTGFKPMSDDDVARAVFEHLSAIEGGEEQKWVRENPWKAVTIQGTVGAAKAYGLGFGGAKLVGSGLAALAPGLSRAPAAAKALGTILGAEGILQGQRIAAGGQEDVDWESAAVNAVSTFLGAGAGMAAARRSLAGKVPTAAAKAAADRLAAIVTEFGQDIGQISLAGARAKREGRPFGGKEFGLELYQALLETGVAMGMPELSPAVVGRMRPGERAAQPQVPKSADPMEAAVAELTTLYRDQEAAAKARRESVEAQVAQPGKPSEPKAEPTPEPREEESLKAAEAAVDILEEQTRRKRELTRPREERRARRAERAKQEAASEALGQAKQAIADDMLKASPGDRLMMSHKDYADRIAQQFGLDEAGAKAVHEHAKSTYLDAISRDADDALRESNARSERERAWTDYRDEQARANEAMQRRVAQAERRGYRPKRGVQGSVIHPLDVMARWHAARKARFAEVEWAFTDSMRQVLGKWRKAIEKATGYGFDPAIRDSLERHGATLHEMTFDLQRFERDRADFLRSTPNPATVDRAMTMMAELGSEQGASVVTRAMPPDSAKRFLQIVDDYRKIQRKAEDLAVELRILPTHRYMVPGIDANGRPTKRTITVFKGDQTEIPKEAVLEGGTTYFREQGGYVHHGYGRALQDEARRAGKDLEISLLDKIGKKVIPGWSRRRTKSTPEWYEQGNVSLDPTIYVMRDLMYRNYVAGIQADLAAREDLVRSEGKLDDEDRYQIQQARLEVQARTAQITQLTKQMREEGIPIWADEDGDLLRRMMPRKSRAMAGLAKIAVEMTGKGIPFEGFPDGFDPTAKGNRKRAAEITAAQARYREKLKTANLYHQVERPDFLGGQSTRSPDPKVEEANARLRELYMLREIAEGRSIAKYKQVHGSHWGALNGKYVRADALRAIKLEMDSGSHEVFRVWDAMQKLAKVSLVAHNPFASGATQITSNMVGMMLAGVNPISGLSEQITAWRQMFRYVMKQERADDPLLNELIGEGLLQSAGLLFDMPEVTKRKIDEGLARAARLASEGKKGESLAEYAIVAADAMRWLPSQIPLFGRFGVKPFRLVDLAPMYGMYRQLRTGIGSERAPMSKERALAFVRDYYDMGDVPQLMRRAFLRRIWDFGRWPVKSGTALAKWAMMSPVTVGIPGTPAQVVLPRIMGNALKHPGTPAHRRALIANVAYSLAVNATKVAGMYLGIQRAAEMAVGVEDDEKYQARKMAEARGSWVRSLFLVPVQKANGDITFYDTWNLSPWGAAVNLFNVGVLNPDEENAITGAVGWLVNKSVLLRTAGQLYKGRDWLGNEMSTGESIWTASRWALPAGLTVPAELSAARAMGRTSLTPAQIALRSTLGQRLTTSVPGEQYRYLLDEERRRAGTRRISVPVDDTPRARRLKKLMDNSTYGLRRKRERAGRD